MILVFLTYTQNLSSQFLDLAIENPLGGGILAKFDPSMYGKSKSNVVRLSRTPIFFRIRYFQANQRAL
jgi:hypothetical protein